MKLANIFHGHFLLKLELDKHCLFAVGVKSDKLPAESATQINCCTGQNILGFSINEIPECFSLWAENSCVTQIVIESYT